MIVDLFPPKRRWRLPLSLYSTGNICGSAIAYLAGAWIFQRVTVMGGIDILGTHHPAWQAVFLLLGVVGVLMSPILFFTREPPRCEPEGKKQPVSVDAPFRFLWTSRAAVIPRLSPALGFLVSPGTRSIPGRRRCCRAAMASRWRKPVWPSVWSS